MKQTLLAALVSLPQLAIPAEAAPMTAPAARQAAETGAAPARRSHHCDTLLQILTSARCRGA